MASISRTGSLFRGYIFQGKENNTLRELTLMMSACRKTFSASAAGATPSSSSSATTSTAIPSQTTASVVSSSSSGNAFDVVVVGGGHAGTEAACAAARVGAKTLLLTQDSSKIGEMSCNPSFGGIGKGHLLREIDALDGICARICDMSGVQYKILNKKKGPAVWGPRAQIDRKLYKNNIQNEISAINNIYIQEGTAEDLVIDECNGCRGVVLGCGEVISSQKVILTTGTFLRGTINIGLDVHAAGRMGDEASVGLSQTIENAGFKMGRMKTGTPPRVYKDGMDFSKCDLKKGDDDPMPFSFMNDNVWLKANEQLDCHMTYTNERTHQIIKDTIHLNHHVREESGTGPRYCPSIESKVLRFTYRDKHQVWLEPEGFTSDLIYPQGISCTMPEEYQQKLINTLPGLENAQIAQPGYGVEYDFIDPRQLRPTLETKLVSSLYFAGQINGTTGYEEAAAQGLVAGVNAAASCLGRPPLTINRTEGYIGVLIDDLTSLGTNEPYRMFTGRAEFRLSLRPDNADRRLTQKGHLSGCISCERLQKCEKDISQLDEAIVLMKSIHKPTNTWRKLMGLQTFSSNSSTTAFYQLSQPGVKLQLLEEHINGLAGICSNKRLRERLHIEASYAQYNRQQRSSMEEIRREEALIIPDELDLNTISGLSTECKELLIQAKPANLAAASRLPGITPAALIRLIFTIKRSAAPA